jgi:hypothetical protein
VRVKQILALVAACVAAIPLLHGQTAPQRTGHPDGENAARFVIDCFSATNESASLSYIKEMYYRSALCAER